MKKWLLWAAAALCMIGAGLLVWGARDFSAVRPASAYEDAGVQTFYPRRAEPVQRENTGGTARSRRLHPSKTVWTVVYRTADRRWSWRRDMSGETAAREVVESGVPEERRVLAVRGEKTRVIALPGETPEVYVSRARESALYRMEGGAAALLFGAGCLLRQRKKKSFTHR